ncbi:hypothetical protein GOP47_0016252 [Adiantum capillus-veneris]|uniref:Photosystem I reaction center subunit III n=1 Tax=Adiantum capillus-veneris TaxID=13818 RepID=A0A9D4UHR0_ADICA|nr:hypothetical protein GOP47_0016252 [Adiantum capillus-veneris]
MASTVTFTPSGLVSPLKALASSKSSFTGAHSTRGGLTAVVASKARVSCAASEQKSGIEGSGKQIATALALAAVLSTAPLAFPQNASADIAGLTPCKDSKAFAKREEKEIKKLAKRLDKYAPDSAPALAINATIEKTKRRFDFYGSHGLLCGADGLPHLIVDGDQAHLGEFVYPGILFLYIAGWIGWVGRSYLIAIKDSKKPAEKEIIIDVPLASRLAWRGFIWPLAAISELRNGKLIEDAANITVSPR